MHFFSFSPANQKYFFKKKAKRYKILLQYLTSSRASEKERNRWFYMANLREFLIIFWINKSGPFGFKPDFKSKQQVFEFVATVCQDIC